MELFDTLFALMKKIVCKLFILYEQKHSWCIMNNTFTHMNIWLQ